MKNLPLEWFDAVSSWTRREKRTGHSKGVRNRVRGLIEPLESRIAPAGLIYRSDVDAGVNTFEVYDTSTGVWTSLGTVDTGTSMTVSESGELFMLNAGTNWIQKYVPAGNTWVDVRPGPAGFLNQNADLEVTNSGEFVLTRLSDSVLYHSSPLGWNTLTMPTSLGGGADYDSATNSLLVPQQSSQVLYQVDLATLTVKTFSNITGGSPSDLRRFGEVYQGTFYTAGGSGEIRTVSLSDPANPFVSTGAVTGGSWPAGTVDPTTGIFYANPLGSTDFKSWNPATNAFTSLAPTTGVGLYHTSLAFVPTAVDTLTASLDAAGNLTITDGMGRSNSLSAVISGSDLVLTDSVESFSSIPVEGVLSNGGKTLTIPLSSVTGTLTFNTGGGDDTLTLNLAAGDFINGGVVFQGADGSDELVILGGNQGDVTYNYTTPGAPGTGFGGSIVMQNFGTVTYTCLEPITNTGTATNIIFNLPAGQTNNAILTDEGIANTTSRLTGATFETTDFVNPTGTITVNPGTASDTLQVNSATDLKSGLIIGASGNRFSSVDFSGALTLNANQTVSVFATTNVNIAANASVTTSGTGDILVNAANIGLPSGAALSSADAIQITGQTLTAAGNISIGSMLTVDVAGASSISGSISGAGGLTKDGDGVLTLSAANAYVGATLLNDGVILLEHGSGLGSTVGGTSVAAGAELQLRGGITVGNESLNLSGEGLSMSGPLRNLSGSNTWIGKINANTAGSIVRIVSDSGMLQLDGDITTTSNANVFVLQGTGNGVVNGIISGPAGLTKSITGAGTWTLTAANTYTGSTTISNGTLVVNGSSVPSSTHTVNGGATLAGTGIIGGTVNVGSGGTLAPGVNGVGNLTTGSLNLNSGSTLAIQVNGSSPATYDRVTSTGNVTINTSSNLSLSGSHVPVLGNTFGIISATGTVGGAFNGTPNGGTALFQNKPLEASYTLGPAGSFQLAFDQTPILNGTAANDQFEAYLDGSGNIVVTLGGTTVMSAPRTSLTSLTVDGGAGDDTLTLNYNGAGGFFTLPVTFNGGTQGANGDELVITSTPTARGTVTHTFTNANNGTVNIDGTLLTYTGLEPITDNIVAANRTFNFSGSPDTITLVDATGGAMTIDSNFAESVTFANPTTSIQINAGVGNDTVSINSMSAAYTGSLTIDGQSGTDTLSFGAGPFGLSGLTITSETVNALPALNIGSGGLQITTVNGISQSGAISVTGTSNLNSGSSAINLSNAGNNFQGSVTSVGGAVTLHDANALQIASINAGGNVVVVAGGDLTVNTISSGGASIALTSSTGAILDGNAGALNVSGAHLELNANTGISLDTAVSSLDADNQTSGNVSIRELDGLNITQLRLFGASGDVSVINATNDTDITTSGLIDGSTNGSILLRSMGQLLLGNNVLAGNGPINLEANRNVHIGGAVTTSGAVFIDSDLNNTPSGAITSAVGSLVTGNALTLRSAEGIEIRTQAVSIDFDNSTSGRVTILESNGASVFGSNLGDDVVLDSTTGNWALGAISAPGSTVVVRTQGGSILDNNGATNNISAVAAILSGTGGVGTAVDSIDTNIDRLEGFGGNGGVFVNEANALQVGGVTVPIGALPGPVDGISANAGNIQINSGALSIVERIATPGNVLLTALGAITESGSGRIAAALLQTDSDGGQILTGNNTVRVFDAVNSVGNTDVILNNNSLGAPAPGELTISGISNPTGGEVTVQNTGDLTITGPVTSGANATPLGGDITISSTGLLTVAATGAVNSRGGSGGTLTLANNVTVDGTITVGFGDIVLNGGAGDLNINAPITVETDLFLNATGNINIRAKVETALTTNNLTLVADTDLDSQGGIRIFPQGELKAGQNLTLTGSDYNGTGPIDSIIIDADTTNAAQLGAFGNIRLLNGPAAPVGAATHLAGYVNAITTGNVTFEHAVQLTADTARVATRGEGNILFNGTLAGAYDLRLSTDTGVITFDDQVGAPLVPVGDIRIDSALDVTITSAFDAQSLTISNAPGTVVLAGAVTTHGTGNSFAINANILSVGAPASAGSGNIVWSVDNLAIEAPVAGTGTLTIQPLTANRSIGLNAAGALNLTTAEIDYLVNGFSGIQIGAPASSSAITIGQVTFNDPVAFISPATGGTISVLGTITGLGNASVTLQAPLITLTVAVPALAIDTADADVTLTGAVILGADTIIDTDGGGVGGTFTQNGTINGPFSLTVATIDSAINLNGSNSAGGPGIGNSQPLTSLTLNGGMINVRTQLTTLGTQVYQAPDINLISGALKTTSGGSVIFLGDVNLSPLVSITSSGGGIIFTGAVESTTSSSGLKLNAGSGAVIFSGPVGTPVSPLGSLSIQSASAAIFGGSVNVQGDISVAADEIDFNGGLASVRGSGAIELKPASTNVPTHVGGLVDQPAILDLTRSDIEALANGFTSITIGRDLGEAGVTIVAGQGITFQDPVIFEQSGRAGTITVLGSVSGIDNASIDFRSTLIQFTGPAPVQITTLGQDVSFDATVINTNLTIDTGAGAGSVLFRAAVRDTIGGSDLTITAGDGDITFAKTVGARTGATLGAIELFSAGTTRINGATYAESVGVNSTVPAVGRTEILAKSITTTGALGQIYNNDVQLNSSVRFNTIDAPLRITGDVDSKPGKTYSLSVTAGTADVLFEGNIGATNSLGNVRVKTKGGNATFDGDIFAKGVTVVATTLSVNNVAASVTQSYTGAATFNGSLTGAKLKINSTADIVSAEDWNITGRTVLKAKTKNISLLGENQFGEIDVVAAENAVIHERFDEMRIRTANVTGTLTLVADENITDGIRIRAGNIVASSLTGSIVLDGVNRIAALGAVSALNGVLILSGGTTLTLTDVISTDTGNIIIAGNNRSSHNVVVAGGSIDLGAGGGFYRIYTHDATVGNLLSLNPEYIEALGNRFPYVLGGAEAGSDAIIASRIA